MSIDITKYILPRIWTEGVDFSKKIYIKNNLKTRLGQKGMNYGIQMLGTRSHSVIKLGWSWVLIKSLNSLILTIHFLGWIHKELMYLSLCWSANTVTSGFRSSPVNVTYEFVLASLVPHKSCSSFLKGLWDRK